MSTESRSPGHFREVNAARRDGRARHVAARVLRDLRAGVDPEQIAREAGMGVRTLRHYLTRRGHDNVAWALQEARARRGGGRA